MAKFRGQHWKWNADKLSWMKRNGSLNQVFGLSFVKTWTWTGHSTMLWNDCSFRGAVCKMEMTRVLASLGYCRLEIPALTNQTCGPLVPKTAVDAVRDYEHDASTWPRVWYSLDAQRMSLTLNQKKIQRFPWQSSGWDLAVQWLSLHLPGSGMRVWSLVGEMRSHMTRGQKSKPKTEAIL